jgi:hypothetical protein
MSIAKTAAVIIALGAVVAVPVVSYVNAYNLGNRIENQIVAQNEKNQNTLSALSTKVMEAAQVPEMAKNDLKEVIKTAMEGRYGNDKTLLFKSVTEAYPGTLDASLYAKLQNLIEAGRNDFKNDQDMLIDKTRVYKTELGTLWTGTWLGFAGYPKINLDDYKIVISDHTAEAFKTKRDNGVKLK